MYHHHVLNLEEHETVKRIYERQKQNNLKGDCISLMKQDFAFLGMDMKEEQTKVGKQDYKKIILEACHRKNKEYLQVLARGKCERIQWEKYEKKDYISNKTIQSVRMQYRTRFGLQRFAGNYSKDKSFA